MNSDYQLVDAMIDHEDVDLERLRRVLDDREARDYLIDACLLRRAVLTEGLDAGEAVAARSKGGSAAVPRRQGLLLSLAIAASLAMAFVAGRASGPAGIGSDETPGSAVATPAVAREAPAFPAPAATRVIQVEFAPTTSGGN